MRPLVLTGAVVLMFCAAYGLSTSLGTVTPNSSNVGAFFAILAAGLALVLGRRSQLALGSALVFGYAGVIVTVLGWYLLGFFGFLAGASAAYLFTRSIAATVLPLVALLIAYTVQFIVDVPLAWAGALLVLALLPPHARRDPTGSRPQRRTTFTNVVNT